MVHITRKIQKAEEEGRPYWSFEYFPPKTPQGVANLYDRFERMYSLNPEFIDVTWGAGGSTSDLTLEICSTALVVHGLEANMHLTCTNMPREQIDIALEQAKKAGIQNILALRGDPPRGQENWTAVDSGFSYAVDLVRYIREKYGDYFCIGVAGYPEGHIDSEDKSIDLDYLKQKIDAGANFIVTQLFYDVDLYLDWVKKVRSMGIQVPILPGIMPIQSYNGFKRMTNLCKTYVPQEILDALEPIKDDDEAVKQFGVRQAIDMCRQLMEKGGIKGFHFYTLNLEKSVRLILEGLNFVGKGEEQHRPLPWVPSLGKNRQNETVRPIFWANRMRSYILRTEGWDDYPNGRWGDSRSPAYGEISGYGHATSFQKNREECLQMWGTPKSMKDVGELFAKYIEGNLPSLPWSDSPLKPESSVIRTQLIDLNRRGFLTINSQPAVDGANSEDAKFGWGPRGGWVYQKAYIEFFVSDDHMDELVEKMNNVPGGGLTYYAVKKDGDLRTNSPTDSAIALTWGVFPGREIVQPTILDPTSFLAWKDEAFALWAEWANLYSDNSKESESILKHIEDNSWLCCVVDNDFKETGGGRFYQALEGLNGF